MKREGDWDKWSGADTTILRVNYWSLRAVLTLPITAISFWRMVRSAYASTQSWDSALVGRRRYMAEDFQKPPCAYSIHYLDIFDPAHDVISNVAKWGRNRRITYVLTMRAIMSFMQATLHDLVHVTAATREVLACPRSASRRVRKQVGTRR